MKKYKLIKEYPGSPKLNTICKQLENDTITAYPEYWEEIKNKNYEIMSFRTSTNGGETWAISRRISNGRFLVEHVDENDLPLSGTDNDGMGATEEDMWSTYNAAEEAIEIHSVKRLSDGEIFTVGDVVEYKVSEKISYKEIVTIKKFHEEKDNIFISSTTSTRWCFLNEQVKNLKRKHLFTTEDGVDIFTGDKYYKVSDDFNTCYTYKATKYKHDFERRSFSSIEAAEEFIIMNKPCLCINDIKDKKTIQNLINYVKSQIL